MQLYILGSGTCVPNNNRGSSGYLLIMEESKVLFDCGNGVTWKLEKLGVNYLDIDHIFISHFHPDHTSDLIPFLFATKYPYKHKREKKLTVWGPIGFNDFFNSLTIPFNNWITPAHLEIKEIPVESAISFKEFGLKTIKTLHTHNSLAYKVETTGKTVVYTGDTDYFPGLETFANEADLLIIECSLPDEEKAEGHLTPSEVIEIANNSNAKKVLLTHLYPVWDHMNIEDIFNNKVGSEVIVGKDLLRIDI